MATKLGFFQSPLLPANPKCADWDYFRRTFDNYLLIVKAADTQKLPVLLNCLGPDGLAIFDGLPEPKDTYENTVKRFNEHFSGRTSVLLLRKQFYEARQALNETSTEFACRLRRIAKECNFDTHLSTMLRDIFVVGVRDDRLGERLLAESADTLTFEVALSKAEAFERARIERGAVATHFNSRDTTATASAVSSTMSERSGKIFVKTDTNNAGDKACFRCGSKTHLANASNCPA